MSQAAGFMSQGSLRGKKILITAGPTWVPLDDVRVISNLASGETGILLAREAKRLKAKVKLFLGPLNLDYRNKAIKIERFRFFDELKDKIIGELRKNKYDIIIHNAAVSDFGPAKHICGKLNSQKAYDLKLKPLPKIISYIRALAPKATLVMFKLEPGISNSSLIKRSRLALAKAKADFIAANRINPYRAFIIDKEGNKTCIGSKAELAKQLFKLMTQDP